MYSTLISVPQLQSLLAAAKPVRIFDCSFELMDPHAGPGLYLQAH
ncbi:MAG: sulfurtransferase, partial [Polaromonas sp.]|nr:sulfurtransferase [Polaromonas sp.]